MNIALWEAAQANDAMKCREVMDMAKHRDLIAQPNAKGLNNWTALHIAADQGHLEACQALLDPIYGADVNARTTNQRTPLHLAVANGHTAVAQLLIDSRADLCAVDFEDNTCLHMAAAKGNLEMTLWLLTLDPDVTARNNFRKMPVDVASTIETRKAIEDYASSKGIRVGRQSYGRTPFAGVLIHNSRQDLVDRLLLKSQQRTSPQALQVFAERATPRAKSPVAPVREETSPHGSARHMHFSDEEDEPTLTRPRPGDFLPLCVLGKGSFGEVYLVRKISSGEEFAMKVLSKDKIIGRKLQRYALTERRIISYIRHPFIIRLHCAFQTPEKLVLVMAYCPGRELSQALARDRKFTEDRARIYLCELILALEELHKHHVIYRDLKPENVLLDSEGHVVLTDFGLAKEGVTDTSMTNSFCGSPAYLAPEMLKKQGHSHSVDWYILGVLLFEMLTGAPPFFSSNRDLMFQNIQKAALRFPKGVSGAAKDLIGKLLERDPVARLGSGVSGSEEVKRHTFFTGVDWEAVYRREMLPPLPVVAKVKTHSYNQERVFGNQERPGETVAGWSFAEGNY